MLVGISAKAQTAKEKRPPGSSSGIRNLFDMRDTAAANRARALRSCGRQESPRKAILWAGSTGGSAELKTVRPDLAHDRDDGFV